MRLPLILGAEPKKFSNNAAVSLKIGKWKIVCENVKDTLMLLHLSSLTDPLELKHEMLVNGPAVAKISILKPGSESYIAVFAELQ